MQVSHVANELIDTIPYSILLELNTALNWTELYSLKLNNWCVKACTRSLLFTIWVTSAKQSVNRTIIHREHLQGIFNFQFNLI